MKYLTVKSSVFIFCNKKNVLFYDTANLSQYLSDCTDEIYCIVDKLLCVENMYSISLDISLLDHTFNWINNLVDNGYAYFHEDCRCLSLPPNLLISSECDQKTYDYLHRVVVNWGGNDFNEYYKQFYYPVFVNKKDRKESDIIDFLNSISIYIDEIVFVSCYEFVDENIIDFLNSIEDLKLLVVFPGYSSDIIGRFTNSNIEFIFIYDTFEEYLKNRVFIREYKKSKIGLVVKDVMDIELYSKFLDDSVDFYPFYDGTNKSFFQEFVYMSDLELKNLQITKREIYRNKSINPLFFGQIYIYSDGRIVASPNFDVVATIADSLPDIIERMLHSDYAWKLLRKNKPCSNCLYQWLCPPISDYELQMKHPLCPKYL